MLLGNGLKVLIAFSQVEIVPQNLQRYQDIYVQLKCMTVAHTMLEIPRLVVHQLPSIIIVMTNTKEVWKLLHVANCKLCVVVHQYSLPNFNLTLLVKIN